MVLCLPRRHNVAHVLIIDPKTNVSDTTHIVDLEVRDAKCSDGVFIPTTSKIYFGPVNVDSVFILDSLTSISDATAIADLSTGSGK